LACETNTFLVWLRASCPGGLTAQLKAEKLIVVPSTANGFRAAVSALRSLDGGEGGFPYLHAPRRALCAALVKNLGRGMPESVVREELEAMDIHAQGIMQLRSGRRDQDPRTVLSPPLCCISGAGPQSIQTSIHHRTLRSASVGGVVHGSKEPAPMQELPALRTHAA
jgi:hypothetical protein